MFLDNVNVMKFYTFFYKGKNKTIVNLYLKVSKSYDDIYIKTQLSFDESSIKKTFCVLLNYIP